MSIVVFLIACAVVVLRRPDAIFNAQFFAEDGSIWYPEAYSLGWFHALFRPQDGYFQTLPRLGAALALLAPLRFAPLVDNVLAIALQASPVVLLMSARASKLGSLWLRAALSLIYLLLPNTTEVHASLEEGQWHLALLACLVLLANPPKSTAGRVFDFGVICLFGVSGPFVVMLLPLAAVYYFVRRQRWTAILCGVMATCAVIQVSALLGASSATRPHLILGATPALFVRILAGHVYLGALLGQYAYLHQGWFVLTTVAICGTVLVGYCVWVAELEWKVLVAFCCLVFAAALRVPMVVAPQWQSLNNSPGSRYWFVPTVAFAWVIVWAVFRVPVRWVQVGAAMALLSMCWGVWQDFRLKPYDDVGFRQYARWFKVAPPGTMVVFPIIPGGWVMRLTKYNPACAVMPEGAITSPSRYATVPDRFAIKGSVKNAESGSPLLLLIDRKEVQRVTPINGSWETMLDLSTLPAGVHEIEARARGGGKDCEADIAIIPVRLTH